jgi:hypothetical protein
MAVSVEYAVEEAVPRKATLWCQILDNRLESSEAVIGNLTYAREFYLLQSVQIGSVAQSAASRGVEEDHFVALKRPGRDAVV